MKEANNRTLIYDSRYKLTIVTLLTIGVTLV